jgi:hypothetical protein
VSAVIETSVARWNGRACRAYRALEEHRFGVNLTTRLAKLEASAANGQGSGKNDCLH